MTANVDRTYLADVVGDEAAAAITDYKDHHYDSDEGIERITGTVTTIEAVSCQFAPRVGGALYPVRGTSVVVPQMGADGWQPEDEVTRFLGYLVDLEVDGPPA